VSKIDWETKKRVPGPTQDCRATDGNDDAVDDDALLISRQLILFS
jgi:hypothetical protein